MQPIAASPPRRELAGCEAHDVDTPWDIDRSSARASVCSDSHAVLKITRVAQAPSEAIDVAFVQKRCNFQVGSLPDRHRGSEYSSALGCQAQPATTTIRRVCGDLDQGAPVERFECGGESGAVQAEEG
jgi:hypothetical protein